MNGVGYKIKKGILYFLLILLAAACLFPFLLMMVNATRSGSEIVTSFTLIPSTHTRENWEQVFKYFNLFMAEWRIKADEETLPTRARYYRLRQLFTKGTVAV